MRACDIPNESKMEYFMARNVAENNGEVVASDGVFPDFHFFAIAPNEAEIIGAEVVTE